MDFLQEIISDPISVRCTEQAVQIVLNLNKDFTQYIDETEVIRKKETFKEHSDLTLLADVHQHILDRLMEFSRDLLKDFIYYLDPQQSRNKDTICYLCELLFIQATLDKNLTGELRKYWKDVKKIDYRCIIEIKDIIDTMVKSGEQYHTYKVRMEVEKVVIKALQEYSLKKIIDSCAD